MRPIIFDATFAIERSGQIPTGIDRVERAWLKYIISLDSEIYFFVRRKNKAVLLKRSASNYLSENLDKLSDSGLTFRSKILWKFGRQRRAVRANLQQFAARKWHSVEKSQTVSKYLKRFFPQGGWYITAGLYPGEDTFLDGIRAGGFRTAAMLHDTIALDYPIFCEDHVPSLLEKSIRYQAKSDGLMICNSHSTADGFKQHAQRLVGYPPEASCIVSHLGLHDREQISHNDISTSYSHIDQKRPMHIILGTIEPRKNHAFILDIWEKMHQETDLKEMPQLVIIGKWGWKIEDLKRRLENSPLLNQSIHLLISPDDATVAQLLTDCNALLMPSFAEGYGLPILEAARDGIPVIANDLAVYREIAGNYPDLCSVDDPEGWERLIKLHSEKRKRLQPPPIPTWDQHFERVMNALREAESTEGKLN